MNSGPEKTKYYLTQYPKLQGNTPGFSNLTRESINELTQEETVHKYLDESNLDLIKGQEDKITQRQLEEMNVLKDFLPIEKLPNDSNIGSILKRHQALININSDIIRDAVKKDPDELKIYNNLTRIPPKIFNDPELNSRWSNFNFLGIYSTKISYFFR